MPDDEHQIVNIALAGIRSARTSTKQGEVSEPWSEEVGLHDAYSNHSDNDILMQARFFTESRLLQRPVRVQILSLPTSTATPFQTGTNGTVAPPASIFIGTGSLVNIPLGSHS
jgi:staphylococcal nuclease domain-containing protein 1